MKTIFNMKKRTAFIGVILSLTSILQALFIKKVIFLPTAGLVISFPLIVKAETADFYIDRAEVKFNNKDYYGAISDYKTALEINPSSVFALSRLGRSKYYLKDYKGALKILNQAVNINANYKFSFVLRGDVKFALGDYYGAISDYSKSIKIDSKDFFPYYFRGLAKKKIGDSYGACSDMRFSLDLSTNNQATNILNNWIKNYC